MPYGILREIIKKENILSRKRGVIIIKTAKRRLLCSTTIARDLLSVEL